MMTGYYDWHNGNSDWGAKNGRGVFWVSTSDSYTNSRVLYFYSIIADPKRGNHKSSGFTIRCVAQSLSISESSANGATRRLQPSIRCTIPSTAGERDTGDISGCSEDIVYLGNFSSRALRSLPLSVMMSGFLYWNSGIPNDISTSGRLWSPSLNPTYIYAQSLVFSSTHAQAKISSRKPDGFSLRCVAFPSRALRSLPLSVMMSGYLYWANGGLYDRGGYGLFWSSTAYASTGSRYLHFYSTNVNPKNGSHKPYGSPLRCIARFLPELSAAFLFRL